MGDELTLDEAAAKLDRSLQTLRRWVKEKRIQTVRRLGRVFVARAEVERVAQLETVPEPIGAATEPARKRRKS